MSRLERMTTSEGANLEYLKNVVLTYMLSTDVSSKNHMLKAIGAVLKLSKAEVRTLVYLHYLIENKLDKNIYG